jgi:SWI/SNF-related matrix-associated actin-dependent regulator 1 of chromatin subfamily A
LASEPLRLDVSQRDGEILLTFPFHPAWVQAIKRVKVRAFDPKTRAWVVPERLAPDLLAHLEGAEAPRETLEALRTIAGDALSRTAAANVRAVEAYARAMPQLAERYPGLFQHQREGIDFLLQPRPYRGALLADDMGLGKTRQAIIAAHEAHPHGRILIVCPASLKLTWAREIHAVLGAQDISVLGRDEGLARWTITNYDRLRTQQATLSAEEWSCLILDEAHYLKNRHSQRSLLVLGGEHRPRKRGKLPAGRIRGLVERSERVILLTGTPITNRPLDLFPLLRAIGHPLGDDLLSYALRYCAAFQTEWGWDMGGASHLDELHDRLRDVLLRRSKDEVLDLPPKLRTYMPVEVDLIAYRKVWLDYVQLLATRKRRIPRAMLLAEVAKLRHAAALAKVPAAIAHVEAVMETGQKVVVFTCHTGVVEALMQRFGPQAVRLTGEDGAAQRQAAVDAFQNDPEVRVFVGNLVAAGVGVSLTAATQVLFVDYSFVPAEHLQAEDRPYRIGQLNAVTVTYLSAVGTLDEEIERLLAQKLAVVAEAIEGHIPQHQESFLDDLLAVLAVDPRDGRDAAEEDPGA